MVSIDPSKMAARPDVYRKKVSWLELFFDLIFALALAMSAKPLEHISDFSWESFLGLAQFLLIFFFLILFWYRHMVLMNRFDHTSFLTTLITLFIGFTVITFTQFIRIWQVDAALGSFLATITMSLAVFSIAVLYFVFSKKIVAGGENEKKWAAVSARHMFIEALFYLAALILPPVLRPFGLILIFIYFNRYDFETYINPKKKTSLPPELVNLPPEKTQHKTERIGLFSLLIYGLVIVLAATPLLELGEFVSVEEIMQPIMIFGKIFLFISVIWYINYRLFEIAEPKGNQFTVITFISLSLLVATTHFIRIMFEHPSNFAFVIFAIFAGLMLTTIAIAFWNVKMMMGIPLQEPTLVAFKQWSFLLYASAAGFFISTVFTSPIRDRIWEGIMIVIFLAALFDRRMRIGYYMGTRETKITKFLDNQTATGLSIIIIGVIVFFVITALMGKPIASPWALTWAIPTLIGIFIFLNHWLHTRIKK
ncbi:low temperature requirement protein A [Candidatus Woesearchaeota archaeon]|nr:low temperature requirement protein A [Candidatus Woesearchaeota archaeon]